MDHENENPDLPNEGVKKGDLKFTLEVFQGPLDLLLHLIKKDEIDIYDIPIESITRQYLEYLDAMKSMNIDIASDFLVTASTLLYIKSRLLLPVEKREDEDFEEEDPRWELVQKLLEYKQFKDASEYLDKQYTLQEDSFNRGVNEVLDKSYVDQVVGHLGVFDLAEAFKNLLKVIDTEKENTQIVADEFSVDQKIQDIRTRLQAKEGVKFSEIVTSETSKNEVICFFLAILELIKLQEVYVLQKGRIFGEIEVQRRPEEKREIFLQSKNE